jgi:hypothetical protein
MKSLPSGRQLWPALWRFAIEVATHRIDDHLSQLSNRLCLRRDTRRIGDIAAVRFVFGHGENNLRLSSHTLKAALPTRTIFLFGGVQRGQSTILDRSIDQLPALPDETEVSPLCELLRQLPRLTQNLCALKRARFARRCPWRLELLSGSPRNGVMEYWSVGVFGFPT